MILKHHVARRVLAPAIAVLTAASFAPPAIAGGQKSMTPQSAAVAPSQPKIADQASRLIHTQPFRFEDARGRGDSAVDFVAEGIDHRVVLADRSATISLGDASMALRFVGNSPVRLEPGDRLMGSTNYLKGSASDSWRAGAAAYRRVSYSNVFPNISTGISGAAGQIDLHLELGRGADASQVAIALDGITSARLLESGDAEVLTTGGTITISAPVATQVANGARANIASSLELRGTTLGLRLGDHDSSNPVAVGLSLGTDKTAIPSGKDEGWKVATDAAGNIYVAGVTGSKAFPTQKGMQRSLRGDTDGFLVKLNPTGQVLYSTFIGGSNADAIHGLALDSKNSIYLIGSTASKDFPVVGAFQSNNRSSCDGCYDAFVMKLNPSGSKIQFATYLGGSENEDGNAIAIDASGDITVAGATNSTDFPVLNAPQATYSTGGDCGFPCPDAFIAKLTPNGKKLRYSTYVGGDAWDAATDLAVDAAGNGYITGVTYSPSFPLVSPIRSTLGGEHDGFVSAMASAGGSFVYSTYLGGAGPDSGGGIVVDPDGTAYVAGYSFSLDYPVVAPMQTANAGSFRSTNGGAEWSKNNSGIESDFNFLSVAVDPTDESIVYMGSWRQGVFKSTNGGTSWSSSSSGLTNPEVNTIGIARSRPTTIYAATVAGVDKSLDRGATWSAASTGLPVPVYVVSLAVDPTNPDVVYASTISGEVYKTVDGGNSWSPSQSGILDTVYQLAIAPTDTQTLYAAGGSQVFKSIDGGESWVGSIEGLPSAGIYSIAVDPADSSRAYAGTAGAGVFRSTDGGATWEGLGGGVLTGVVTSIAVDPTSTSTVYAGVQGLRSFRFLHKSGTKFSGASASGVAFDSPRPMPLGRDSRSTALKANGNTNGGVFKTIDGGQTWTAMNQGLKSNGITAVAVAASRPSTVFTASNSRGDATLTVLAPGGQSIVSSTYLGGSDTDEARAITKDAAGNLYITGVTFSEDYPTSSPIQSTLGPNFWGDGFATRLNPSGTLITGSTYLGGADDDALVSVAVDPSGALIVTGLSWSSDFPTSNAGQPVFGAGGTDAVISKIPAAFGAFAFSTYLGGYRDKPYVYAAGGFENGIIVEGNFFSPNAVVYVNDEAQITYNAPEVPTTILLVPELSFEIHPGDTIRVRVSNANGKRSNSITLAVQ